MTEVSSKERALGRCAYRLVQDPSFKWALSVRQLQAVCTRSPQQVLHGQELGGRTPRDCLRNFFGSIRKLQMPSAFPQSQTTGKQQNTQADKRTPDATSDRQDMGGKRFERDRHVNAASQCPGDRGAVSLIWRRLRQLVELPHQGPSFQSFQVAGQYTHIGPKATTILKETEQGL